MENKDRYFKLLKETNGQFNEIVLGEKLGLNEDQAQTLIAQLLSEHKIDYAQNKACNYSVIKKSTSAHIIGKR